MNKSNNTAAGWYANVFKAWPTKLVGAKPTDGQLDTIHKLGARPGKQALANALALRDGGVTGAQIVMACGAPQLNKMRGFIADGLLKVISTPASDAGHKVYHTALTAKGQAKVDRVTKAQADAAANAAAPAKPAKAKRKAKATTPAPEAQQPASNGAANEQPQASQ